MSPHVQRVASGAALAAGLLGLTLSMAAAFPVHAGASCPETSLWIDSALDDGRIPVRRAAMAWTGSEALIWGGEIGYRFDPALPGWQVMSGVGAPGGYGPLHAWTETDLLVWGGTLSSGTNEVDASGARYSALDDSWTAITSVAAPSGRRDGASAWTGIEWVIWGGRDEAGTPLSDGAVYDPAGGEWAAVTASGAPTARYAHSMTWTGSGVLLFGGRSGGTRYADLLAYDPAGGGWTSLTSPVGEAGRSGHAAVWTGDDLLIYGGEQNGVGAVNTGWRYRPATGQWTAMTTVDAPEPGATTRAVWSGSELVVWSGDGTAAGRYDPANDEWSTVTASGAPSARGDHSIAWLEDRLMVWGGGIADGGIYDPILDEWTPTDPVLPTRPMRNHTAVWTGNEVLFWGGQVDADHASASGYRYAPATNSWGTITSVGAPTARRFHTAVWTGSEMIVWGGQDAATSSVRLDNGGRYDPATDSWAPMTAVGPPDARTHHGAVWTGGEMIVWGGWVGTFRDVTATGGRYDPATDAWTSTSTVDAPGASRDPQVVWTGSRMIVWSGGVDQPDLTVAYSTSGAAYDPLTDEWTAIADAAPAGIAGRMMAAVGWTGDEILIWSGAGDPDTLATGGRYDPDSDLWTPMSTVGAPGDRRKAVGVWTGDELLVYGGVRGDWASNTAYLADGGFYRPGTDTWTPLPVDPALGPRALHSGAWTGDRLVAFGGQSDGGVHNAGGVLRVGVDADADSICDTVDNCLGFANADQADFDADGIGDACDICPATPDPDQADSDSDGIGDACAWCSDPDGDGACDVPAPTAGDRCPGSFNPSGRKLVLTGYPFDGREVTRSYLREASDGAPLVVFAGDLAVAGTSDLFTQRPFDDLTLTSLGVAAAAGPGGYALENVYDEVALFFDQDASVDLYGVGFENGAPPNRVDPLPAGYQISRHGTKIIFDWGTQDGPCEFGYSYPAFATVETATGFSVCYGVYAADQTIADWTLSSDRSWFTYLFKDYNSSVGARIYARHLDFNSSGEIDSAALPDDIFSAPSVKVRDDGLALVLDRWDDLFTYNEVVSLRVGSSVRVLSTGDEYGPRAFFSNEGDGIAILHPYIDPIPWEIVLKLLVGSVSSGPTLTIEDPSVHIIDTVQFAPGESHFAFTSATSTVLHVSPVAEGGPVTQVATAGNTIGEFGFAPDVSTLLFVEERSGNQARELWAVAVGGGTPVRIGPIPQGSATGVDEWTFVDGRLIVYGSFDASTMQLYSMEPDGSDLRSIDLPGPSDSVAQFWVGFDGGIVLRGDGSTQLLLAPAPGGAAEALTSPGLEDDPSDPQIAEDGSFLIYDAQIASGDRETVILFTELPDQDLDGILDPCDCLPSDPAAGQSPGLVYLRFTDAATLDWNPDGVSDAWTIYRGNLALLPGEAGSCLIEGHPTSSYVDSADPPAGTAYSFLVAGEGACGTGEVAPRSDGDSRNVTCP